MGKDMKVASCFEVFRSGFTQLFVKGSKNVSNTKSFISNIKKRAKKIQVDSDVKHTQALEVAAKEAGFPNYYALLQHSKKANNHKASFR